MHNIKDIRNNLNEFKKLIQTRNSDIDIDQIKDLDEKNRKLILEKENLEKEKKDISKKKDEALFKKSKEISVKIDILNKDQSLLKKKLDNILSSLPNLPLKDIPIGKDESSNKEVKKVGNIQKFDFKAKSHLEIG